MAPRVSVLVPCYNRARTIERCVRSALEAGGDRIEVIVSDNGSTDETAALVERFSDARVRLIRHEENRGPLPNWEACLERARAPLVHWLWSDDWVEPGFYDRLLAALDRDRAEVAWCAARIVDEWQSGERIAYAGAPGPREARLTLRRALEGFTLPLSPAAWLLPTESVRRHFTREIPRIGGIDCNATAIGCDAVMVAGALLEASRVTHDSGPLVNFSFNPTSITATTGRCHRATHYAWARMWWSRRQGLPRRWNWADVARLAYCRRPAVAWAGAR